MFTKAYQSSIANFILLRPFFSEGADARQIFRATSDSTKKFGAIECMTPLHQKLTSKELDQLWNCNSATVHVGTITVPLSILFHTGVILI